MALGYLALACAIAGRWTVWGGILLAVGPALIRSARPYGTEFQGGFVVLDVAPFLLALLYLVLLSRRSLRLAASRQARTDPDVL